MNYHVPTASTDPKPAMIDCTGMPDVIAAGDDPNGYVRTVRTRDGKVYVYASDLCKWRGEDVEIKL